MIKSGRAPDFRDRDYARREPDVRAMVRKAGERAAPRNLFEKYEQVMQDSFRSLCEAVAFIKNKHLYRQAGFETFEECCEKRWGWTRQRGYQLAGANATLKSLPKNVNRLLTNEAQTRAIAEVPQERRVGVLKTVARTGPVSAPRIKAEARGAVDAEIVEPARPKAHTCPTCGLVCTAGSGI